MSSGRTLCGGVGPGFGDDLVDLSGDVAFEAPDHLPSALAFGDASCQVVPCPGIPAQAGQGDAVQRGVGLPVAAAVEAASGGLAGG
jgi:hypothetical protein